MDRRFPKERSRNAIESTGLETLLRCWPTCGHRLDATNHTFWSAGLQMQDASYTTVNNSVVHENFGEGIGDVRSDHTTIEDCVEWDGWAVNLYLDNSQYTTVRRNIIYASNNAEFFRDGSNPSPGIIVGNEDYPTQKFGTGQLIANNFVYNTGQSFGVWDDSQHSDDSYTNSTIEYNTFVSTRTPGRHLLARPHEAGLVSERHAARRVDHQ